MMKIALVAAAVAAGLPIVVTTAFAGVNAPALPADFRSWTVVRSQVVSDPDHAMYGFHQVYANKPALRALRSRTRSATFSDGAAFVVSIYEPVQSAGTTTPGAKRRDVVRVKDRRAVATGGWRFAAYDPAGKPIAIDAAACYACHAGAKDTDTVFSRFID
jgi:hypothetical protein